MLGPRDDPERSHKRGYTASRDSDDDNGEAMETVATTLFAGHGEPERDGVITGLNPALEELQTRNANLLEALDMKKRQVHGCRSAAGGGGGGGEIL